MQGCNSIYALNLLEERSFLMSNLNHVCAAQSQATPLAATTRAATTQADCATWQAAIDQTIDEIGWRNGTRVENPHPAVSVYMVDVRTDEDLIFTPEGPPTFSLSVFLEAAGTFSVEGAAPLDLHDGLAILFACNHITRGENRIPANTHLHFIDIRFELPLLEELGGVALSKLANETMRANSRPEQDIFLIGFNASPELLSVASALLKGKFENDASRRLFLYSKALEALNLGLHSLVRMNGNRQIRPLKPDEKRRLETAITLIDQHYNIDWTIARLAREVGLNEKRLKEAFRLEKGNTVHAYLRSTRIDVAASLLQAGASVTDAAYTVGFENLSHFSKIFRDAKGVLPSLYGRTESALP